MANGRGCRPTVCRDCGKLAADGAVISFRGLCEWCAIERQIKSAKHLAARDGEYFDRWCAAMRELADRLPVAN